jgi:hypothetical protein
MLTSLYSGYSTSAGRVAAVTVRTTPHHSPPSVSDDQPQPDEVAQCAKAQGQLGGGIHGLAVQAQLAVAHADARRVAVCAVR